MKKYASESVKIKKVVVKRVVKLEISHTLFSFSLRPCSSSPFVWHGSQLAAGIYCWRDKG